MSLIWRSSNFLPNFNNHHLHKIPHKSVLSETEYLVLLSHDKEATAVVICQVHIYVSFLYTVTKLTVMILVGMEYFCNE